MTQLAQVVAAQLHALTITASYRLQNLRRDERGSVTIQEVLWAIAAIGFVAIVVAAITGYLNTQAGRIR